MAPSAPKIQRAAFRNLFAGYEGPPFVIRLWNGEQWSSSANQKPVFTLVFETPLALEALLAAPNELTLGEAFIRRDLDVEGDLISAFCAAEFLFNRSRSMRQKLLEKLACAATAIRLRLTDGALHSPGRDQRSISYHYDQPVEFFEPWLGRSLVYSCGYFEHPDDSLDTAQQQKLALITRKLDLQRGEQFLDIGCGWGSLVMHAGAEHGARARGITLSQEQAATAKRRIEKAGLCACCSVELRDYRDTNGSDLLFDKIASVGMFEHVGRDKLALYFETVRRILKPGGVFLNHGIARFSRAPVRKSSFIERHVFPDGRLVTLPEVVSAAESQGLEVRDVENLREHYDLTLQRWMKGLRRHAGTLLELVPESTYRTWLLYIAGSAAAFRRGDIGVYQVLLSRPERGRSALPLTRNRWYSNQESLTSRPVEAVGKDFR